MDRRVVFGPPGTGKTTRLIQLARESHQPGVPTAFVSFTKAAANELKRRTMIKGSTVGTIHSLCYAACELDHTQVVDDAKTRTFLKTVGLDGERGGVGVEVMSIISKARSSETSVAEAFDKSSRPCSLSLLRFYADSYESWKQSYGFVDFDDMLQRVSTSKAGFFEFDSVYIDEAQDISSLQWRAVSKIVENAHKVVVAGDDDQAIFEWAGADSQGMVSFTRDFEPEVLRESFRIPRAVHDVALNITRRISNRVDKPYTPRAEAGAVREIGSCWGVDWGAICSDKRQTAFLYRDVSARFDIDPTLISARVPFRAKSGGASPWDMPAAKAFRTMHRSLAGEDVPIGAWNQMSALMNPSDFAALTGVNRHKLRDASLTDLFEVPDALFDYFRHCDMITEPNITLSTIHGFKGAECDRVMILTSMSDRVSSGFAHDPDAEHRVWYVGVTRPINELIIINGVNGYPIC